MAVGGRVPRVVSGVAARTAGAHQLGVHACLSVHCSRISCRCLCAEEWRRERQEWMWHTQRRCAWHAVWMLLCTASATTVSNYRGSERILTFAWGKGEKG